MPSAPRAPRVRASSVRPYAPFTSGGSNEGWSCARTGCPCHHEWKGPWNGWYIQWCCQACRNGQQWHTTNCSGAGCRVVGVPEVEDDLPPLEFRVDFPNTRMHWNWSVIDYVQWLANEHYYVLTPAVVHAWQRTQWFIDKEAHSDQDMEVVIHVFKNDRIPPSLESKCIDVHNTLYLDAYSDQYTLGSTTGVHPPLQAKLVLQENTANAICLAVMNVEMCRGSGTCCEVAFSCRGGTHRSLGCACLLASLAYPNAIIVPATFRTRKDANKYLCAA